MRIQETALENRVQPVKGNAILAEFLRQFDGLDNRLEVVINNYYDCRAIFNVNGTSRAPERAAWRVG
jgi:hypothetical protein